ncbi:ABC transporter transmembrane domain-containing protein [Paenibacillus sp. FSL H8-0034]|uniref:ABC transporter transmembrane domain-containing protein n=1 Tax=Paenibacillus sp. FSL H8-0034 TaxID=2954671 RepID=UPI0030F59BBB
MQFFRTLMPYLLQNKLLGIFFICGVIVEVVYLVAAPLSLKYLVDEAFVPKNFQVFVVILSILVIGGVLSVCAGTGGDYALNKLSGRVIQRLRTELFAHMQKQSLPFFEKYRVGDLVSRFSSDMASIERVICQSFPFLIKETLSILMGLVMLLVLEWKLTLAMLIGSILMFIGPKLLQGRAEASNAKYKEAQEQFSNMIDETVKGYKTVKALHQQDRLLQRAQGQIRDLLSLGLNMHILNSLLERLPLTVLLVLNGMMIGFGGYLIFHDEMTVGDFIAFFTLFMSVGQSASNLSYLIPNLIDSSISFKRIAEILNHQPSVPEASDPVALPPLDKYIEMNQVTFGFTEGTEQIKEVSLRIAAGSYAAFVGPSGSGKSTALQLLSRFYDPRQGSVRIDGYDLKTVSEASLRRQMDIVFQDTFLFNTTIRDNLRLGSELVTDAEMMEAAELARIHETLISWPEGYDTLINNEGASLSGGQRQRISIARALLRQPRLLLLDEVTSALDPATEADINQTIQQLRHHTTIISVTHRLSSIVNADVIFVFKDGRIVESGTHQELLQQSGLYHEMWEKQHGFMLSQDGLHATVDGHRLAKFPFFAGVDSLLLQNISTLFSTETFKEGDTVVQEGDQGDKFYIIVRGKFEILKSFQSSSLQRVATLQDGDHFGEIALLKGIPRTATVRAMGPSVLLSVRREAFLELTAKYPQIFTVVERTLKERI